jgi:hypothetical protein
MLVLKGQGLKAMMLVGGGADLEIAASQEGTLPGPDIMMFKPTLNCPPSSALNIGSATLLLGLKKLCI